MHGGGFAHGRGCVVGACVVGGMRGRWQGACMAGGMCGRGACMVGDMCGRRGGMCVGGHVWHTVNERAVRILLECILVWQIVMEINWK